MHFKDKSCNLVFLFLRQTFLGLYNLVILYLMTYQFQEGCTGYQCILSTRLQPAAWLVSASSHEYHLTLQHTAYSCKYDRYNFLCAFYQVFHVNQMQIHAIKKLKAQNINRLKVDVYRKWIFNKTTVFTLLETKFEP